MSLMLLPFTAAHDFGILLKGAGDKGILLFLSGLTSHIPPRHERLSIAKFGPYPLIEEVTSLDYCIFCNYHLFAPFQFSAARLIGDPPVPALYGVLDVQEARLHALDVRAPVHVSPGTVTCHTLDYSHNRAVFARHPVGSLYLCHDLTRFPFVFCDMTIDSRNLLYGQRIV